jgi:hypothetical protein
MLENIKDKFDRFLKLDPWNDDTCCTKLGLSYYMGNFVGDNRIASSKIKLIWDSGGLQLRRGIVDFLNPHSIGEAYTNRNIYAGVTLDLLVPRPMTNYLKAVKYSSTLQRLNTERIGEAAGSTKILNVIHGYSVQTRKMWLDNSYSVKYSNNWCLADFLRMPNLLDKVGLLLKDILNLKRRGDLKKTWVHLLGVATNNLSLFLIPLSSSVKLMTSDATTALISAINGTMYVPLLESPPTFLHLGKNNPVGALLPCSCDVCNLLGSTWVYSKFSAPLAFHNIFAINSWYSTLGAIFDKEGIDGYCNHLSSYKYSEGLIRLIRDTWELGISDETWVENLTKTKKGEGEYSFMLSKREEEKRFWYVLQKYIKYHKEVCWWQRKNKIL